MNYLFEIYGKNDVGTRAFSKMYCACFFNICGA